MDEEGERDRKLVRVAVERAQAALTRTTSELSKKTIRAPFAGVLALPERDL